MSVSIEYSILYKIKKARRGSLFFTDDFLRFGTAKAVSKALERLERANEITRIARGIYTRLAKDPVLGNINPGAEAISKAIAKRDRARIIPTGVMALNVLGLSTQIPMNVVYLTDGAARKIILGKRKIIFKKASPKNLSAIGKISGLCIQALKVVGKDKVTEKEKEKIIEHLKKEEPGRLEHDIRVAPEWIRVIMREAINKQA